MPGGSGASPGCAFPGCACPRCAAHGCAYHGCAARGCASRGCAGRGSSSHGYVVLAHGYAFQGCAARGCDVEAVAQHRGRQWHPYRVKLAASGSYRQGLCGHQARSHGGHDPHGGGLTPSGLPSRLRVSAKGSFGSGLPHHGASAAGSSGNDFHRGAEHAGSPWPMEIAEAPSELLHSHARVHPDPLPYRTPPCESGSWSPMPSLHPGQLAAGHPPQDPGYDARSFYLQNVSAKRGLHALGRERSDRCA
mmetsp:Transcript_122402/g.222661  ORF Transcript_122402/g.222661 Transcript_122402/m.222661 type:complete len:249 (+) Transcript_122402:1669-2415(+)